MTAIRRAPTLLLAAALAITPCTNGGSAKAHARATPAASNVTVSNRGITKVLVIAEENHAYGDVIGSPNAPYLTALAGQYGSATRLDAGYPTRCPSLAAYVLLTSGTTGGICDDRAPKAHRLAGDNLFHQVTESGREWRDYAEAAPGNCALTNSSNGRYLVRHVPATYYVADRRDCARWAVPMGTLTAGALHHDLKAGALPAFSFVSPNACHDMHGAPSCLVNPVGKGDRWLRAWLPAITAAPDFRAGRLLVIITWDEGTRITNHVPTLVVAPGTRRIASNQAFTHCSTLRITEEILRLPLLGCAAEAASMRTAFKL